MKSTAEGYYKAALEHLDHARWLHEQNQFYLSHFFSGLAVECMLRAYLRRISDEFDPRHDLYLLAKKSKFFDVIPYDLQIEYGGYISLLNLRWHSNHRYFSERDILTYWSNQRAEFNTKGNRVENISRVALNMALDIVNLGARKWQMIK